MLEKVKDSKHQEAMQSAVNYVKNMGFEEVRARLEGYDSPATLKMKDKDREFTPDITGEKNGARYYFEIADRNDQRQDVVSKWKLLNTLAAMKQGSLRVFVPYGSMKFTNDVLGVLDPNIEIIKL